MDRDSTEALVAQVREATARGTPLRIVGGDTKRFYGRAVTGAPLETRGHSGILSHDPAELVLTARGGTPLARGRGAAREPRPAAALRTSALRCRGDDRRRRRLWARGPGTRLGRRTARLRARRARADRRRPGAALRRRGDEERRRLRRRAAHGRLARHPRRAARRVAQGAAAAGRRANARARGRPGRRARSICSTWPHRPAPFGRQLGGRAALPAVRGLRRNARVGRTARRRRSGP